MQIIQRGNIIELYIIGSQITEQEVKNIYEVLENNQYDESVFTGIIYWNYRGKDPLEKWINIFFQFSDLTTLNLSSNHLRDSTAILLAKYLANDEHLTKLSLYGNFIKDTGAKNLAVAIKKHPTLLEVNLEQNCIENEGAEALSVVVENNYVLEILNVAWNLIKNEGAESLQNALRTNSNIKVDFRNNYALDKCYEKNIHYLNKSNDIITNSEKPEEIFNALKGRNIHHKFFWISKQTDFPLSVLERYYNDKDSNNLDSLFIKSKDKKLQKYDFVQMLNKVPNTLKAYGIGLAWQISYAENLLCNQGPSSDDNIQNTDAPIEIQGDIFNSNNVES